MTLTQSLVYLGLALLVARTDGACDDHDATRPFWRPPGVACKVSRRPEVPVPEHRPDVERAVTIGIWCNWQHDWFWSS